MKRRDFLTQTALGAAAAASAGLGASENVFGDAPPRRRRKSKKVEPEKSDRIPVTNPVLVVIFLRGGQDQLNTIVPYHDKTYYDIRPTIAVSKEEVIKLDERFGFHPGLAPLKPFYDEGRLAAVINSGSPHGTRSHFDAQDFMEYAAPGMRFIRNGWLNRYLIETAKKLRPNPDRIRAVAMQELLPRSLRGKAPVITVPPNLGELEEVLDLFEGFYGGHKGERPPSLTSPFTLPKKKKTSRKTRKEKDSGIRLDPVMISGQETIYGLRRLRKILYGDERTYGSSRDSEDETPFQEYPGHWFAKRLKAMARLIKADVGLEVVGTDINGWDHHIGLGSIDGTLNRMLTFLSEGLAAFMTDLGPDLDRTLILICTEFGRVAKENGNDGSDHGHGGAMWLMGGRVKGGKIYGEWTGLKPEALHEKRDQPVTTDFRDIFAEVLRRHMNFDPPAGFFPKYQPPPQGPGLIA